MPQFDPNTYVDVQERIDRFWTEHPDGAIVTRLMSPPDDFDRCRYEAAVYKHRDDGRPSAVGYAFELAGTAGANRTSHEENCETSAIGRALANMGYAKSREDRPSRQEMAKAVRTRETTGEQPNAPPRPPQRAAGPSAPPTPIEAARPGPNLAAVHAAAKGKVRGDAHEAAHQLATVVYGVPTMKALTGGEADALRKAFGECAGPDEGEALIALAVRINAATDSAELDKIADDLRAAGLGPERRALLAAAFVRVRKSVRDIEAMPREVGFGDSAPAGSAGADRWTS